MVTVKSKVSAELLAQLDALAADAGLSRADFLRQAIEAEVKRREIEAIREEIAILEINSNILKEGQSVTIGDDGELRTEAAGAETCALCQEPVGTPAQEFDGPRFCEDCLALAKGGDFSQLLREP